MRTLTIIFLSLVSFGLLAQKAETRIESFTDASGSNRSYRIHFPSNFDSSKTYKVVIGPGDTNEYCFYWDSSTQTTLDWIAVTTNAYFGRNAVKNTELLMEHLNQSYKVENDRFTLIGFSANSGPSFNVGMELAEHIETLVGVAGYPRSNPKGGDLEKLKGTNFYFIVSDDDRYWYNASKASHDYLKGKGINSYFKTIKNGGHAIKSIVGEPFFKLLNEMKNY